MALGFDVANGGSYYPELKDSEFREIRRIVYDRAGIYLGEEKKSLVVSRLGKRLRALGLKSFKEYINLLRSKDSEELVHFIDAITTNYTYFFREEDHMAVLRDRVVPWLRDVGKECFLWSAGCASGEEPYTIAITLMEALGNELPSWNIKILATDISTNALSKAKRGIYQMEKIKYVPKEILKKYFLKGKGRWEGWVKVKKEVMRLVEVKYLNLIEPFSFNRPFHVIFCRNVMIYFDADTRRRTVERMTAFLVPGGFLFLGHSETLPPGIKGFRFVAPSVYRKEAVSA